jgi:hypothetical protein
LCIGLALGQPAAAQCPTCGTEWSPETVPGTSGQASQFAPRRAGASVGADIRFGVASSGLYRVTQPQLVAAGLAASNVIGSQLRLFCRTQEVAIVTSTEGLFTSGDFLQFYGTGHRGYYTPTNVYWLASSGSGLRMATLDASTNSGGTSVTTHDEIVEHAPDLLYRDFYRPLEDSFDHWFAALLDKSVAVTLPLTTDRRLTGSNALIVARLFGLTTNAVNPDHKTQISINGFVTNFTFDGENEVVVTGRYASTFLSSTISTVSLIQTQTGVTDDKAYLDYLQLCFPRTLGVRNGWLTFCGQAGTNVYTVVGLATNSGVTVLDISLHANPLLLTNLSFSGSGTNFSVHFRTETTNVPRYLVAAPSVVRTAAAPSRVFFRDLASTNHQADYLVVTPYAFRQQAYRLLKHRASNGLAVAVAPLEDVYNEFGYGIEDAAPVQHFIGYTFHHWSNPAPRYAVLMGEGTYDPKNNLGTKPPGFLLPVKLGPTPFSWSPRDNWFGTVNGTDSLVDVVIGRMAGTTTNGISRIVNKTITYELASRIKRATVVADNVDVSAGYNFSTDSDVAIYNRLFSNSYSVVKGYLDTDSTNTIRTNIRDTINGGRNVVTFFGHGNTTLWCAEDVWNANDIASLTNSRFPIITVFSCQNGSFEDPGTECLAERFLEQTTNGAVAVVAPSSESAQIYATKVADGFFAEFTNTTTRLGDSLAAGLTKLWQFNPNPSELWSYGILGDPALKK